MRASIGGSKLFEQNFPNYKLKRRLEKREKQKGRGRGEEEEVRRKRTREADIAASKILH